MSRDPNMNNASDPPEQAAGDPQYVPKQPSNYGQKEMLFQPPTALPRPNFPEGQSLIFCNDSNSFANLVKNSGYTSVPLHGKFLKDGYDFKKNYSLLLKGLL